MMLSGILQNVRSIYEWMIDIIVSVEHGYLSASLAKYDTLEKKVERNSFYHKWKKMMAEKW